MRDPAPNRTEDGRRRFLTFRVDDALYALPTDQVSEVIRTPAVARLPHGPKSLLGLANLRGAIVPLASARGLLGRAEAPASADTRTIVLTGGAPAALAVDAVGGLLSVEISRVQAHPATELGEADHATSEVFQGDGQAEVTKILDVRRLLNAAFVQRPQVDRRAALTGMSPVASPESAAPRDAEKLITFEVSGQEYGMALERIREIVPAPSSLAASPFSEAVVLGVMDHRDGLLPLLSLRGLLGFELRGGRGGGQVLITEVGGVRVGLLADRTVSILPADPDLIEPTPPLLMARAGGETRVRSIYRGDGGRRLVSILVPENLFREEVMQRLIDTHAPSAAGPTVEQTNEERTFLVFKLGAEEFALPIAAVDEIAHVPERITRIPKTPKFLEGVINLRGEVLPVIDQRRRFDLPPLDASHSRRLIVMRTQNHRACLIVDGVSEVLRCTNDKIGEAPDLAGEATRLVQGVINLESSGRMVLLLDPTELLTRAELKLLAAFESQAVQVEP